MGNLFFIKKLNLFHVLSCLNFDLAFAFTIIFLIVHLFLDILGGIFETINGIHGINKQFKEIIHVSFVGNDEIYFAMLQLKCNTLPRVKCEFFICQIFLLGLNHMLA